MNRLIPAIYCPTVESKVAALNYLWARGFTWNGYGPAQIAMAFEVNPYPEYPYFVRAGSRNLFIATGLHDYGSATLCNSPRHFVAYCKERFT